MRIIFNIHSLVKHSRSEEEKMEDGSRVVRNSLSHELLDLGFLSALFTTERNLELNGEGGLVQKGFPLTYDVKNGILVVYDEFGRPWIHASWLVDNKNLEELIREYDLECGAYVPHADDEGRFIRNFVGVHAELLL